MHYQTHHPFFFHFHPIASINPPPPPSSSPPSFALLSSHSSQVGKQEMECVEGALKGSFRKELALKSNHQQGYNFEEFCTVNGQSGVVSVEDFSVDDLLDFSKMGANEDDEGFLMQDHEHEEEEEDEEKSCLCVSVSPSQQQQQKDQKAPTQNSNLPFKDDFGSSELSVPTDDVADLEWLSHFVEDSFSEYSALTYPAGTTVENTKNSPEKGSELDTASPTNPSFVTPVPVKARSKRTRTGGRLWSFGSSSATTESSSSSSSSSSSTSSPSTPWLIYAMPPGHNTDLFNSAGKVAVKKQKKRPVSEAGSVGCGGGGGGGGTQVPRRCSHCGVQKTPQWRTGPLGAKTLCNACGVRFKSGRLLPEYRPACSPTFSSDLHSNHHRKVLEMRKKKDMSGLESGLAPAVHSF